MGLQDNVEKMQQRQQYKNLWQTDLMGTVTADTGCKCWLLLLKKKVGIQKKLKAASVDYVTIIKMRLRLLFDWIFFLCDGLLLVFLCLVRKMNKCRFWENVNPIKSWGWMCWCLITIKIRLANMNLIGEAYWSFCVWFPRMWRRRKRCFDSLIIMKIKLLRLALLNGFCFLLWFIGYFLFVFENWKEKAIMWLLRKWRNSRENGGCMCWHFDHH